MVSFLFLALCIIPAKSITRQLKLSRSVFYIFVELLFSSPLYLYWGRTFMIETTAVFCSVAGISYFIEVLNGNRSWKTVTLFVLVMTLSILQKATTGLPVLAVMGFIYLAISMRGFLSSERGRKQEIGMFIIRESVLQLYVSASHCLQESLGLCFRTT